MRNLVVKVTCGADDPERSNQGFTVAATAIAAGVDVSLWLAGEAVYLADTRAVGHFALEGAAPISELLATVLEHGRVTVCTQCAARRGLSAENFPPQVRVAGAATFVEEALRDDTQALVY